MIKYSALNIIDAMFSTQAKGTIKRVRLGRTGTSLKVGLLGMANIGKSSTFNLLSNLNVPAENIPFCTIDPNTAFISVQDTRFERLCKLYNP
jgi:obg-like ATPase 1